MNESQAQLQQHFTVSADKVYQAWTQPDKLKLWWSPMDNKLVEVTNELKEGGSIDYLFNGNQLHISGNYISVKENELLEYTWNWELPNDPVKNSSYKLTVQFKAEDNGSSIIVTQIAMQDNEGMLPHHEGWKKALADLSTYLKQAQ